MKNLILCVGKIQKLGTNNIGVVAHKKPLNKGTAI